MGKLIYGGLEVRFEDRVLAHLQLVIGAKLRRGERFFLSWRDTQESDVGRTTLWIDPSISLIFRYKGDTMPTINRQWLDQLTQAANSGQGLMLSDEPTMEPGTTSQTP